MNTDTRTLDAVITLATKELSREDWHDRAGSLRALLEHALPFLVEIQEQLAKGTS